MTDDKKDPSRNHEEFFEGKRTLSAEFIETRTNLAMGNADPAAVKQALRRGETLKSGLAHMLTNRAQIGSDVGDRVMFITHENFAELILDPKFKPLSTYIDKLVQRDAAGNIVRKLRPIMANEVGVYEVNPTFGKIVILNIK